MIPTSKQEPADSPRFIHKRSTRITTYCCLLLIYSLLSFWNYSDTHLASYDKWQLAGLILIAVGSLLSIIFQFIKHETLLFENMSGAALIGGGVIYFIGICIQIGHECYCDACHGEFQCGCGVFGTGVIIFGTSIAVGIDVITNFLSHRRIRLIILSSILITAALFILINRFNNHLSTIKVIEEIGWILIGTASLLIIIFIAIMDMATHHLYNGFVSFLLLFGGIFAFVGGIGGYTSSNYHASYNGTIWIFYILVLLECIVLIIDIMTRNGREYQPIK